MVRPGHDAEGNRAVARRLARIDPAHAAYYRANAAAFTQSLSAWDIALEELKHGYPGIPVATTEPVADYLLQARRRGERDAVDVPGRRHERCRPVAAGRRGQAALLAGRKVRAFVYNIQVTDPLTRSLIALANANGIPVVGVYETMPRPGFTYQSWMLAESAALKNAITAGTSTERL